MRVHLTGMDRNDRSGGFSFNRNIQKALPEVNWIADYERADVIFVTSATLVDTERLYRAKQRGAKILFRVDNLPKESNNRGTAYSRLKLCAEMADVIVYQSEWAKYYVGWFVASFGKKDRVIYNGVDTSLFHGQRERGNSNFLYVGRKAELNKHWGEAWYKFHLEFRANQNVMLNLVGTFPSDVVANNFDFVAGEQVQFWGQVNEEQMAILYQNTDVLLAPYFNDAFSNVLVEAYVSGCKIWLGESGNTGGTPEMFDYPRSFYTLERMGAQYRECLKNLYEKK